MTIKDSLTNKNILITGSTGFLGKVFLCHLLKKTSGQCKIYLLIRSETLEFAQKRFQQEILNSKIFQSLNIENLNIEIIKGDVTLEKLGLENEKWQQLQISIDYVINIAASINFYEPIKNALKSNFSSVRNILYFTESSLKAKLLHVSTCYVSGKQKGIIAENINFPSLKYKNRLPLKKNGKVDLVKLTEILSNEIKEKDCAHKGKKLANYYGWNDIYTITKWMGEQYLDQNCKNTKCAIVRPSIITSSIAGNIPGWIEGFKVIDPLVYFVGTNKIKHFTGNTKAILDLVPVDMVADSMLAVLNNIQDNDTKGEIKIFQISTGHDQPLRVEQLFDYTTKTFNRKKSLLPFFIPITVFNTFIFLSKLFYSLLNIFSKNKKIKITLKNLQMLKYVTVLFGGYSNLNAQFVNENIKKLESQLNKIDQMDLAINPTIDWKNYIAQTHIPGLLNHVIRKKNQESLNF